MLERVWSKGPFTLLVGMQTGTATMENSVQIPLKTGNRTATNPATPLLSIHTEKRDTCPPVFTAAPLTITRTWEQPRCSSADEWIRKSWYMCTKEYYSAIKRNRFESVLMKWMELEPIIQTEVSQKEKHQYSTLTHTYGI